MPGVGTHVTVIYPDDRYPGIVKEVGDGWFQIALVDVSNLGIAPTGEHNGFPVYDVRLTDDQVRQQTSINAEEKKMNSNSNSWRQALGLPEDGSQGWTAREAMSAFKAEEIQRPRLTVAAWLAENDPAAGSGGVGSIYQDYAAAAAALLDEGRCDECGGSSICQYCQGAGYDCQYCSSGVCSRCLF